VSKVTWSNNYFRKFCEQAVIIDSILIQGDRKVTQPIFIDGCNSVQLDCINKHTISLWLYKNLHKSRHVVTYSPFPQLSSNNRSARMSFSQVQRMFIVERYLVSRSCLNYHNEFRDTFPDFPVPNKSTISLLVKRFRDTRTLYRVVSNVRKRVNASLNAVDISNTT
jgi:hypothetical protein